LADRPPRGWMFPTSWWLEALAAERRAADARTLAATNDWTTREIRAARRRLLVVVTPAAAAHDPPP